MGSFVCYAASYLTPLILYYLMVRDVWVSIIGGRLSARRLGMGRLGTCRLSIVLEYSARGSSLGSGVWVY